MIDHDRNEFDIEIWQTSVKTKDFPRFYIPIPKTSIDSDIIKHARLQIKETISQISKDFDPISLAY